MGETGKRLIVKDEAKRLVYGIVYEPNVVDSQGDYTDADEIEKACHNFMLNYQEIGRRHFETSPDIKLVECYVAPENLGINGETVRKGAWLICVKVFNDEVWKEVLSGELTGFSFEGTAREGGK